MIFAGRFSRLYPVLWAFGHGKTRSINEKIRCEPIIASPFPAPEVLARPRVTLFSRMTIGEVPTSGPKLPTRFLSLQLEACHRFHEIRGQTPVVR